MAFDVIHFVDAGGYLGRYARSLRSQYDAPGVRTVFTVHGPGDWHRRGNLIPWQSDEPLEDMAVVEVYVGSDGDLWARRQSEFHDGRFEAIREAGA